MNDDDGLVVAVGDLLASTVTGSHDLGPDEHQGFRSAIDGSGLPPLVGLPALAALRRAAEPGWVPAREHGELIVAAAHELCRSERPPPERQLGAIAVHLLADTGAPRQEVRRRVHASLVALELGRYGLAAVLAQTAIMGIDVDGRPHEPVDLVEALSVRAVAARDASVYDRAVVLAERLTDEGHDGVVKARVRDLRPPDRRLPSNDPIRRAGDLLARGATQDAAATLDQVAALVEGLAGDELLTSFRSVIEELRSDAPHPDRIRDGLQAVVAQLLVHQSLGAAPTHAHAAVRVLLHLVMASEIPEKAAIVLELFDAIHDAGLSNLPNEAVGWVGPRTAVARVVTARVAGMASRASQWPSTAQLLRAAAPGHALLVYCTDSRPGRLVVAATHVPPDGRGSYRDNRLSSRAVATVESMATGDHLRIASVPPHRLTMLADELLPRTLVQALATADVETLTIVPHERLWSIPWAALPVADHRLGAICDVTVVPSLSLLGRLGARPRRAGTLVVAHDPALGVFPVTSDNRGHGDSAESPDIVEVTDVSLLADALAAGPDVLLVVGHGVGDGLDFRIGLESGTIGSLDLLSLPVPPVVLLASCWSGRRPSSPLPLGMATGLLLTGARSVIAGLWDLPADPTVPVLENVAAATAVGARPATALRSALESHVGTHPVRWAGLYHQGRFDPFEP